MKAFKPNFFYRRPGKSPAAWLLWDLEPHIQGGQGMAGRHKHKVGQKKKKKETSFKYFPKLRQAEKNT